MLADMHANIWRNSLSWHISKWLIRYTASLSSSRLQRSSDGSTTSCGNTSSDVVCRDFCTTCGWSHFTGDKPSSAQTYKTHSIRSSNTLNSFRCHLKTHYFQAAFNTPERQTPAPLTHLWLMALYKCIYLLTYLLELNF